MDLKIATIIAMLLFMLFYGIRFHIKQNVKMAKGGPIGFPKLYWLCWTIFFWFLLPIPLFFWQSMPTALWAIVMCTSLSFWIRGVIELYMLYVTHNWIPPYGMSHDLVTFIAAMSLGIKYEFWLLDWRELFFACTFLLSLLIELYYAYAFYQIMKGKTTGEEGEWFAHPGNPKYKRILMHTTIGNYILLCGLLPYFLTLFSPT